MWADRGADHVQVREEGQQRPLALDGARRDCRPSPSRSRRRRRHRLAPRRRRAARARRARARAAGGRGAPAGPSCGQSMAVRIPTDLLTPLGAYLRLREGAAASFLLESVEQGRLGRHSFIGSGTRLVSFEEAEALGEPVVGYLAYDHVAKLEPTVQLPADGPDLPESRFVVAETLVRFDHGSGTAEVLAGDGDGDRRQARKGACVSETQSPLGALNHAADARPGHVRKGRGADPRAHPRRGRVPGRALAAGGAPDVRVGARALPRAAPRQSVAVSLPARARRPRARRLLAGDARQVRGRPGEPEPDRRHDASRRGRRGAAARLGEGPRRARDARRPRPQRPLPRLRARERPRRPLPRAGALLARHPPRLGGDGRPPRRRDAVRPPARVLSGRHRLGSAEGAGDADRLRARGLPPRPLRRRRRLRPPRRDDGHVHRDPDDRARTRALRGCRRAPGSWQTRIRPPSTRSA